jgi:antitoxin (DNA-binding transcriptional repressor) of toxin-antitoxin stability system
MRTISMFEAESTLSRLMEAVESGAESEIIIARNGRPAARLFPVSQGATGQRIGIARGAFEVPDGIDGDEAAVATLFSGTAG